MTLKVLAASLLIFIAQGAGAQSDFITVKSEFITDSTELERLLKGNSLIGTYNDLHFIQLLKPDGQLEVAVKGEETILKASWYINDKALYCEQWPDHISCFRIGIDPNHSGNTKEGQRLLVEGTDEAKIVSFLHQGLIPLIFD